MSSEDDKERGAHAAHIENLRERVAFLEARMQWIIGGMFSALGIAIIQLLPFFAKAFK